MSVLSNKQQVFTNNIINNQVLKPIDQSQTHKLSESNESVILYSATKSLELHTHTNTSSSKIHVDTHTLSGAVVMLIIDKIQILRPLTGQQSDHNTKPEVQASVGAV